MNPTLLQEILLALQNDATLQRLAVGGIKVAFATLPTLWPSITVHLESEQTGPATGAKTTLRRDTVATIGVHIWTDDGRGNALWMQIDEQVNKILLNRYPRPAQTFDWIKTGGPIHQYERDTRLHHASSRYTFSYTTID